MKPSVVLTLCVAAAIASISHAPFGPSAEGQSLTAPPSDVSAAPVRRNLRNLTLNLANYNPIADGVHDDSAAIGRMFADAARSANTNGAHVKCVFPGTTYALLRPIDVPESCTELEGDGLAVFVGQNNDAFRWQKFWRGKITNLGFKKMARCLVIPTCNVTNAHQVIQGCVFDEGCELGIDGVSFDASRSTVLVVRDCISSAQTFLHSYADITSIDTCDVTYVGADHEVILLDSKASIHDSLFTPAKASTANSVWIKLVSSEIGRGVVISDCRFGAESGGGMPVVESWAKGNYTFRGDEASQTRIHISDSLCSPVQAPTGRRAIVLLHAMPNSIALEGLSGSTPFDGFVAMAKDFAVPEAKLPLPFASVKIDDETLRMQTLMNPRRPLPETLRPFLSH